MKNKIGLKILVISVVLVMLVSCVTPCIAVGNTTNNISNSSFSLEDTPVNVSVENGSKSLINENETILAVLIVEEGCKAENVIHRENLGDLNLDALFVETKVSEIPELSERVKNIFFPKKVEASFLVEPAKAVMIGGSKTSTYDKKYVIISGVYSAQELLKFAKESKIVRIRPEIAELKIDKSGYEKLDGFLSSFAVLTPSDKVNAIVELRDIPKYKELSYKEASEKARESEVVKDAVKAVEDLGGGFIDYWHWYDSIDVEIEASKLSELARHDFVEKITWGGVKWEIEPMVGVEATDVRPTDKINEIIYYLNARHLHNREYDGAGVKVGIIDTGIDESHPEFDDAIIVKKHDVTGTGFDDYDGHGTMVASCVNYIAPKAELWIYKCSNSSASITDICTCIDRAMKEVNIISLSWGSIWLHPPYSSLIHGSYGGTFRNGTSDFCMKVDEAISVWNKTFVKSAGNAGNNHDYREIGENAANYSFDVENLDKKIEIRVWWDDEDGNLSDKPENNLYLDIYENETNIHDDHDWIIGDSFQHVEFTPETTGTYKASVSFRPEDYEEEEKQDYHIQISGADFDLTVKVGGVSDELNRFNTTTDPANAFLVISVGALMHDYEQIADLSSRGPTRDGRIKPEIVAPGWYIPVAVSSKSPDYKWGKYSYPKGTSLSAPLVSGCIALFMQAHPEYKNDSHETHLKLLISALDMGESGSDNIYGYEGLVDAFGMLSAFGDRNCPKPNVKIEYSEVGAKVKFKVKLTNSGDSSSEANGVYIKLENATFESVANGTFDGSYAYNISNPEELDLRPGEYHMPIKGSKVIELYGSGNNAESGEIVINPEKDISDVKINYRAWILDEDDIIENPYNNESEINAYLSYDWDDNKLNEGRKEPYIARYPVESEPENPAYNRHIFDTDYSFLNYSCYKIMPGYVPFQVLWRVPLGDTRISRNCVSAGDIDGNGIDDIAISGLNKWLTISSNGSILWSKEITPCIEVMVGIADTDGDKKGEVFFHADRAEYPEMKTTLYAFDYDGTELWEFVDSEQSTGPVAFADLDLDGLPEIITIHRGWACHKTHAFDGDGTLLWEFHSGWPTMLEVGDMTGDEIEEIIISNQEGEDKGIMVLNRTGRMLWKYYADWYGLSWCSQSFTIGDLTGDGINDVAAVSTAMDGYGHANVLYTIRNNGSLLWYKEYSRTPEDIPHRPVLIDINNDGIKDVITGRGAEYAIYAYRNDGELLWTFGNETFPGRVTLSLFDIDRDGEDDIIFQKDRKIYKISTRGEVEFIAELENEGEICGFADVNGDGFDELIISEIIGEQNYIAVISPAPYGNQVYIPSTDTDGDGVPDVWDMDNSTPAGYWVNPQGIGRKWGDMNGDGKLTSVDALMILQAAAGAISL